MPFTPVHFGPHACLGLPLQRSIDVPVFIASNIAVDIEPLLVIVYGLHYPLHGYCHTFLIGSFVGLLFGLLAFPFRKVIGKAMLFLLLPYAPTLGKMVLSGILGVWLHIFFDAPLYIDIKPFYPLSGNPFLDIVSMKVLYGACALLVVPALVIYLALVLPRKAGIEKAS